MLALPSRPQAEGRSVEAELAVAVAAGDQAAFVQLVCAYQDRLYGFALRLLGNVQDAEEVVQDTFVQAHRALRRDFSLERARDLALTPWLLRITLNTSRNRRRRHTPTTVSLDGDALAEAFSASPETGPEALAEQGERQRTLSRALQTLATTQRAAVILRFVEGLDYEAISAALGRPVGTVKSDVFRGARALRAVLDAAEQPWNGDALERQPGGAAPAPTTRAGRRTRTKGVSDVKRSDH